MTVASDRALVTRETCPACGERAATTLVDLAYDAPPLDRYLLDFYDGRLDPVRLAGERFRLERCADCRLVFQRHVPGPALLTELYEELAHTDAQTAAADRGFAARRRYSHDVEQLLKYWGRPAGELQVLDFGSGHGFWLDMATAYGLRAVAADVSSAKSAAAASAGREVIDAEDLGSSRFHFVNTDQVFEHLVDPADTLRRLADALVPGGILRIAVPNGGQVDAAVGLGDWTLPKTHPHSLNVVAPLEHVNCWDHHSLARFGPLGGLEPFRYPLRQYLDPMERTRITLGAVAQRLRPARGTLLLFRRPR